MSLVKKEGVILSPTDLPFENHSVLNPGVFQDGNNVHIIYRAIDKDFMSCLGYARLEGPTKVVERWDKPFLYPTEKEESSGIEDARIVKIDGTFYMTYVVHDGRHAISALSTGTDILDLKRFGVVSPKIHYKDLAKIIGYSRLKDEYYFFESFYREHNDENVYIWHKDMIFFPEKINDRFVLMQRILPDIQLAYFDDPGQLKDKYYWLQNLYNLGERVLLEPEQGFEARHIGGGAPPIRTEKGWLIIYHACQEQNKGRIYHAGAALLDIKDPSKVIARLPYPLFSPSVKYEITGTVNNVVFPTGTAQFDGRLYIYYGAADRLISVASVDMKELLDELEKHKR